MKLVGKAAHIEREVHPDPRDGVHHMSGGKIKGVHCIEINGRLIPKGMNCIFLENGETGYKVFYSLKWGRLKPKAIEQEIRNIRKLSKYGMAPKIIKRTKVKLDFKYMGRYIKYHAPAIEVETVDCPRENVEGLAKGRPYDWNIVSHPDHAPAGFLDFKKRVKKKIKELNLKWDGSLKIGDVLWDQKTNKWMLVDCS